MSQEKTIGIHRKPTQMQCNCILPCDSLQNIGAFLLLIKVEYTLESDCVQRCKYESPCTLVGRYYTVQFTFTF